MENTDKIEDQETATPADENKGGTEPATPADENKGGKTEPADDKTAGPFKTFKTQEDFDKHSAGIKRSAEKEAEKRIMAQLGLNPDEKDKLAEFKKTYEASLTDAEKQVKTIDTLTEKVKEYEEALAEKDAVISTLSKIAGKTTEDVAKITKMARSLVSDTVTMDDALDEVFKLLKLDNNVPKGTPPVQTENKTQTETNPFAKETFNMTEQGRLMANDPDKARRLYALAYGKNPSW